MNKYCCLSNFGTSGQFRRKTVALAVSLAIAGSAYANPVGLSVVAGQATSQTVGQLMQITNSPGAILNWQQFNIDLGQTTQFIQQNSTSQVFNRVTGGEVSQILGALQSNGQVFLINPAGVFFGQGAVIDTAGFLASTLAASDTDLLNGHLRFHDANNQAGGIVNQGNLKTHSGGSIVLLAPSIDNTGIVHANGEVLLAAGHSVTIMDMKHPTIGLTVAAKAGDQAINLGKLISQNTSVFSHLVKNNGVVEASQVQVGEGGVIRFIAQGDALVGGQLLAEGVNGKGGEIDVTGQRVAVLSGARVSADGTSGGGTVHLGGGWKGQDDTLSNAQQTVVQVNATVSTNALVNGDGGEVVVWADGHTVVNSEIQAQGGALGGHGGRVETSGKQTLEANVAANTSAPNGQAGQWLIDPANLTIVDQIPSGGVNLENSSMSPFFSTDNISSSPSPIESFLLSSTVVSALESNNFVTISTAGTQAGDGNLTISAPVLVNQNFSQSITANPQLFLEAKGKINIDAAVGLMPGQTTFNGFDLFLNYDIAKPVNLNAPLYLGDLGNLVLAPYDIGTPMPVNISGQPPLDGVNFLSGMNNTGTLIPITLNQISASLQSASGSAGGSSLSLPIKLNILGANLKVNEIFGAGSISSPGIDILVNSGSLNYHFLSARSMTVESTGSVSTYSRTLAAQMSNLSPFTNLQKLTNSGTVSFNGGSTSISELNAKAGNLNLNLDLDTLSGNSNIFEIVADPGSTLNVLGGSLTYGKALFNGVVNVLPKENMVSPNQLLIYSAFVNGLDTDLNGSFSVEGVASLASLKALGMGPNSQLLIGAGASVRLGSDLGTPFSLGLIAPKQPGVFISSTNGQFVVQQGAQILMNGAVSPLLSSVPVQSGGFLPAPSLNNGGGARLDISGLDGQLDAPVIIDVKGYGNAIVTDQNNYDVNSVTVAIDTLKIQAADIHVDAGGDGPALRIGSTSNFQSSGSASLPVSSSLVDIDFNGTLTVNGGRVRLEGDNLSITGGVLNVAGTNSTLIFDGKFSSADLYGVSRSNNARLVTEGFWDNSGVTASNLSMSSPLSKGNILVGDDLIISGGVLSSVGTSNALDVLPDSFLELRNVELATNINIAPTSTLMFGRQDETGLATPAVVLNDAKINMAGDALLIVETDENGFAELNGKATISSGHQGNLILAGRRVFDPMNLISVPDSMTLNFGSDIRLNVNGNSPSLPPALSLFYSQRNISTAPTRPVFLLGELTPEAVAIIEYEEPDGVSSGVTTVLSGFANPSFIVDGTPDSFTQGGLNCSVDDFCMKFDVAQNLNYSGMLRTTLGENTPSLTNSGVSFVSGSNLSNLQFSAVTANAIHFLQGINVLSVADLVSGKKLISGSNATVRLSSNLMNENIINDIENNGLFELQGNYSLNGVLTGTGTLSNTGVLNLGNNSGSLIQNPIINSGTINNMGNYTLSSIVSGTGMLVNSGSLNVTGSGVFGNSVVNSGSGQLDFNGAQQNIQFASGFSNTSDVQFSGGSFSFSNGYNQISGNLIVQQGAQLTGDLNINGGTFSGFADITGNLNAQGGRIIPGASPGLMVVSGDLNLDSNSVIDIEIQNAGSPGIDFDAIVVQGNANLAGQLNLIDISAGTLTEGNQYSFLEANAINGFFNGIGFSAASSSYEFSLPAVSSVGQIQQISSSVVSLSPPPPVLPPSILPGSSPILTGSTGSTDSVISQSLEQAFTPTSSSVPTSLTQPASTSGSTTTDSSQQTQQEEDAVEAANQNTAGTLISQQNMNIELKSIQSDPQRASAVCK
jgi:filamentous hemagglutinin family protein